MPHVNLRVCDARAQDIPRSPALFCQTHQYLLVGDQPVTTVPFVTGQAPKSFPTGPSVGEISQKISGFTDTNHSAHVGTFTADLRRFT